MIRFERKRLIVELLTSSDVAYIGDLAKATGASDSTVRRDIDELVAEVRSSPFAWRRGPGSTSG